MYRLRQNTKEQSTNNGNPHHRYICALADHSHEHYRYYTCAPPKGVQLRLQPVVYLGKLFDSGSAILITTVFSCSCLSRMRITILGYCHIMIMILA